MMENYSLSDIKAAVDGNEGGYGMGGGFMWIIVLFLFLFGSNGLGNLGGAGATAAAQQEILYGQQFQGINSKLNEIGNGICNSTYALNQSITGEGRQLQNQLAECCCENRLGIANLNANMNEQTCAITTAIHAEADATRAMMRENEIQSLRDKVNDLQRDAALCGVVRYPLAMTYSTNCNPFCGGGYCGNGYQPNI